MAVFRYLLAIRLQRAACSPVGPNVASGGVASEVETSSVTAEDGGDTSS